jgi:hypothetical protein
VVARLLGMSEGPVRYHPGGLRPAQPERTEIVAGGSEHGVDAVAVSAFEVICGPSGVRP